MIHNRQTRTIASQFKHKWEIIKRDSLAFGIFKSSFNYICIISPLYCTARRLFSNFIEVMHYLKHMFSLVFIVHACSVCN